VTQPTTQPASQPTTPAATGTPTAEGYDGPAQLLTDDGPVDVEVRLRGQFQPIDGRYHWYGRVSAGEDVDALVAARAPLVLRTPHGDAAARLADRDPWGRYRVTGTGRPPFPG
jgi:hypothetical protein